MTTARTTDTVKLVFQPVELALRPGTSQSYD
jgi:hypothetical protein